MSETDTRTEELETFKEDMKKAYAELLAEENRPRKKFAIDPPAASNVWLISFTDIMALMLTFFVLLFSMSEPEKDDWSKVAHVLQVEFNKFEGPNAFRNIYDALNVRKIGYDKALDLSYLKLLMERLIEKNKSLSAITLQSENNALIISLPDSLLFQTGKTDLSEEGSQALFPLAGMLSRIDNRVEIVGHTDPRPLSSESAFPSNWELSLSRALVVAGVLENLGYSKPLIVRGLSSGRYNMLPDDMSEAKKQSVSRRVDIILMQDDGKKNRF